MINFVWWLRIKRKNKVPKRTARCQFYKPQTIKYSTFKSLYYFSKIELAYSGIRFLSISQHIVLQLLNSSCEIYIFYLYVFDWLFPRAHNPLWHKYSIITASIWDTIAKISRELYNTHSNMHYERTWLVTLARTAQLSTKLDIRKHCI